MNPLGSRRSQRNLWGSRLTASPRSFLVGELVVQGCSFSLSLLPEAIHPCHGQDRKERIASALGPSCTSILAPCPALHIRLFLATTSYLLLICKYLKVTPSLIHVQSAFLTQSVARGGRLEPERGALCPPHLSPQITTIPGPLPHPIPKTHQFFLMCQKTLGTFGSSLLSGRQKSLLPLVAAPDHCTVPSTKGSWRKSLAWETQSRTSCPFFHPNTPSLVKIPRTVSPCPHPHVPSANYHSRISYVKVGPNFIHVAGRNLPCPQELLQFQDAGARRGFGISPQLWERGFRHGPAHPPLCLCGHSSLPLQCHSSFLETGRDR